MVKKSDKKQKNKRSSNGKKKNNDQNYDNPSSTSSRSTTSTSKSGKKRRQVPSINDIPTTDDVAFRRQLESDGTRSIHEMEQDGNCLFRSLSDRLYNDWGRNHERVRIEICDYLQANESSFGGFVAIEDEDDDGGGGNDEENCKSFADYVERMREDGEWGGNLELVAAANRYRRNITVFSAVGAFSIDSESKKLDGENILLSYHDNDHYNSVHSGTTIPAASSSRKKSNDMILPSRKLGVVNESIKSNGDTTTSRSATKTTTTTTTPRQQNRNEPCSCGSGLKYKKCCHSKTKMKGRTNGAKKVKKEEVEEEEEEEEVILEGNFKILRI